MRFKPKPHISILASKTGFTVLELMIATTVFGVLLLMATGAVVQLSNQFQKGLVQSRTQEVARTISEEVANNIKYSASAPRQLPPSGTAQRWCISDRTYAYRLRYRLDGNNTPTPGVFLRLADCNLVIPNPLYSTHGEVEFLGDNMRLANFEVIEVSGTHGRVWVVNVRVVYGENDAICSNGVAGDCQSNVVSPYLNTRNDLRCKDRISSSRFCATAAYTRTVVRRL